MQCDALSMREVVALHRILMFSYCLVRFQSYTHALQKYIDDKIYECWVVVRNSITSLRLHSKFIINANTHITHSFSHVNVSRLRKQLRAFVMYLDSRKYNSCIISHEYCVRKRNYSTLLSYMNLLQSTHTNLRGNTNNFLLNLSNIIT